MKNLTLFCFISLAVNFLTAADWPQWRGPNRDGISQEKGIIKDWQTHPPKLLWKTEGCGNGYSSVSIANGVAYTTGNFDGGQGVIAFDLKDGKLLWRKKVTEVVPDHGYGGARCMPSVVGEHLYVITSDGSIACLTTKGDIVWQKDFSEWDGKMMSRWGFSESPLVDGEVVLCTPGGKDAFIVALDRKSGAVKWKTEMPDKLGNKGKDGAGYSSLVISNGAGVKQYVQMAGRGVVGVRASDGKFLWVYNKVANGVANIPTPLISGDHVFCSTGYGTGSALLELKADGSGVSADEVYFLRPKKLQNHHGGMILVDHHVYCGHKHNAGLPVCVDMKSGEAKWGPEKGVGSGSACPVYVDGHFIFRYQSGHVVLIQASTDSYEVKGSFMPVHQEKESWAHPVVSGGKLYLREQDVLMCYQL